MAVVPTMEILAQQVVIAQPAIGSNREWRAIFLLRATPSVRPSPKAQGTFGCTL